jgi:hypothetical protein
MMENVEQPHVEQPPKHVPQPERCILAHDLNNSLNLVLLRCEMLGDLIRDNREAYQHLVLIQEAARQMAHSIAGRPCHLFGTFNLVKISAW